MFKSVESVLRARSVAIVGASPRAPWPNEIFTALQTHGYAGRIYSINPRYSEVWERPCYPGFDALPEPVEHAVVIVAAPHVIGVVQDGVENGLKSATIYAAGVGDGEDPEAGARGERLRRICADSGLVVCGPNCMGTLSWREKLFLYPNGRIADLPVGGVAVAFQSGGTLQFWVQSAGDRGVRFSYAVSTGNELNIDLADYINFFVEDEGTKVIVLFIEGIRRPEAFMAAAAKALAKGKPIIAIKSGRSARSREAALSHTGAVAGDYAAYEAMCERYGIINCRSLDDMVEVALAFQAGRLPKGNRAGFVTTSGGTVDLLLDYTETEGVTLAPFCESTVEALTPLMQDGIVPKNPLDAGIPGGLEHARKMCEAVLKDPNIDMVAWAAQLPRRKGAWGDSEHIRSLLEINDKPFFGFGRMIYRTTPDSLDEQDATGVTFLQGMEPTLRALRALSFYAERKGRDVTLSAPPRGRRPEIEGEKLIEELARYGVTAPSSRFVRDTAEAAAAAAEIGYPVAVKVVSPEVSHKTEIGGVKLNLRTPQDVETAIGDLASAFRKAAPAQARISGFLMQEMVFGIEVIIGARSDEHYGPMLLIGSGGVMVELLRDTALHLLPVAAEQIEASIAKLKLGTLLQGFRGGDAADVTALAKAAAGLGDFFLEYREHLSDIEINPLIVRTNGKGIAAVDVRPVWR